MTTIHFQSEIERLVKVFGDKAYPKERTKLIWDQVKYLSDEWMTNTVNYFIGYLRTPPLMAEFGEQVSRQREKDYSFTKSIHSREAKDFMQEKFLGPDDVKFAAGSIIRRLKGGMSDEDYKKFIRIITPNK